MFRQWTAAQVWPGFFNLFVQIAYIEKIETPDHALHEKWVHFGFLLKEILYILSIIRTHWAKKEEIQIEVNRLCLSNGNTSPMYKNIKT
jgi:hypothetical protein